MLESISRATFEADVARLDPTSARKLGWTVVNAEYPVFDVILRHGTADPLRLQLECTQWNELPPSVRLLKADGSEVAAPPPGGGVFHPQVHPVTGRFFVCMRGTREYHTHFSHVHEHWEQHREEPGNDLIGIVGQIYRAWRKAVG